MYIEYIAVFKQINVALVSKLFKLSHVWIYSYIAWSQSLIHLYLFIYLFIYMVLLTIQIVSK